jgi:hypothetical protein
VDNDISILDYELISIGREENFGASWPGEQALRRLVLNTSGLSIWTATACRSVREGGVYAAKRLSIYGSTSTLATEQHLNKIYTIVLKCTIRDEYLEEEKQDIYSFLKKVLRTIILLYSPLPVNSLSELLHLPKGDIERRFTELHVILNIPKDTQRPLRLYHPSFRDFLLSKDRYDDLKLWVDKKQGHRMLADTCIQLMSTSRK